MSAGLSTANLANKWLDMLRGVAFTGPSAVYIKLHTGDPGSAGTANASAVTTRNQITWNAASTAVLTLSSLSSYSMTSTETISYISAWDAASAGTFLFSAQLSSTKSVVNGDALNFVTFSLTMFGVSTGYLANKWFDMLRGVAFTAPSAAWVQLHTDDPGSSGTSNVSALTTRNQVTWNAATSAVLTMSSLAAFTMNATETVKYASVWDASTNGNFLFSAAFQTAGSFAVVSGDTITFSTLDIGWPGQLAA